MERLFSCGAAIALALGVAASARADVVTVTYSGTVTNGDDLTGVFGVAGANLAGDSYTIVYTVNDSIPAYSQSNPPDMSQIFGGSHYSLYPGGGPVSATLTIDGSTISIGGQYYGRAWQSTLASGRAEIYDESEDRNNNGTNTSDVYLEDSIFSPTNGFTTSWDYHTPLSYSRTTGDYGTGTFTDIVSNNVTGLDSVDLSLGLNPTSVTVASVDNVPPPPPPPAVPEPATWAMLVLGVGMIGFAARRRNEGVALAA